MTFSTVLIFTAMCWSRTHCPAEGVRMRGLCVKSWGFSRETSGGASTTLKIGVSTPFNTHGLAGMLVQKHEGQLNEMNVIHGAPCACSLISTCPCFCPCLSSVSKSLIPAVMSPSRKKKKSMPNWGWSNVWTGDNDADGVCSIILYNVDHVAPCLSKTWQLQSKFAQPLC